VTKYLFDRNYNYSLLKTKGGIYDMIGSLSKNAFVENLLVRLDNLFQILHFIL
jgi:hypothetical protein